MGEDDEEEEGGGGGETAAAEPEGEEIRPVQKKLTNQFNFCERAALTYNNPVRVSNFKRKRILKLLKIKWG